MMKVFGLLAILPIVNVNAFLFGLFNSQPLWDTLKVTWSPIPFQGYTDMPRDAYSLSKIKFKVMKDGDMCAKGGKPFLGLRYRLNDDPSLTLLYDEGHIIAGIQTSVHKDDFTPPEPAKGTYFIEDGDYWTQTAYFIPPESICDATKKRTKQDLGIQGTGTGLWLQTGPDPVKDVFQVPLQEEEIKQSTDWRHGACLPSLGQHYWIWNKTINCDDIAPNCLLYSNGKLTGFCFTKNGWFESANNRYAHFQPDHLKLAINFPDCMLDDPKYATITALHVFFTSNARTTTCLGEAIGWIRQTIG